MQEFEFLCAAAENTRNWIYNGRLSANGLLFKARIKGYNFYADDVFRLYHNEGQNHLGSCWNHEAVQFSDLES